ncbi:hypothetical protein LU646_12005 [Pseudomonas alloputida]|uniref:hypothetical protein n=1 Tax=Pseudomonas alloputida TaxID=1940621 RepID=UPI001E538347|nr:hypothetical protein [Pseudomonas alloputida]MCE1058599.1 hypothetical protein [Pseudomonas alloputida]
MSITDQQLLELAAKAAMRAGLKLECPDELDGVYVSRCSGRNGYTWNPLEDDGDALRLAVRLRISLLSAGNNTACDIPHTDEYVWEDAVDDSAARRAIVRAAAEIGKSMQEKH